MFGINAATTSHLARLLSSKMTISIELLEAKDFSHGIDKVSEKVCDRRLFLNRETTFRLAHSNQNCQSL